MRLLYLIVIISLIKHAISLYDSVYSHQASKGISTNKFSRSNTFFRECSCPSRISVAGEYLYVTKPINCVSVFHLSGQFVCSFYTNCMSKTTQVCKPWQQFYGHGIVVDNDGLCFVCLERDNCIVVF